jgi:hypothetical protein
MTRRTAIWLLVMALALTGSCVFGDLLTGTAGGWFLDDNASSGGNILTLAGTTPTITVNALGTAKTATIGAVPAVVKRVAPPPAPPPGMRAAAAP